LQPQKNQKRKTQPPQKYTPKSKEMKKIERKPQKIKKEIKRKREKRKTQPPQKQKGIQKKGKDTA
jgi:hypothetical protein